MSPFAWVVMALAVTLLLLYRWHLSRQARRAWDAEMWDCEDGEALRQFAMERAEAERLEERRAALLAPLPWWTWPLLLMFNALAVWMLIDLWGTPRIWMALIQLGWPIGTLVVAWRRWQARATVQDDRTGPVAAARARRSLTPSAPRRQWPHSPPP